MRRIGRLIYARNDLHDARGVRVFLDDLFELLETAVVWREVCPASLLWIPAAQVCKTPAERTPEAMLPLASGSGLSDDDGLYIYLFDIASDTAWWSKRRMVAVLKRGDESPLPEHITRQMLEKSDAELRVHPNWLVVVSRHSVASNGLASVMDSITTNGALPASLLSSRPSRSSGTHQLMQRRAPALRYARETHHRFSPRCAQRLLHYRHSYQLQIRSCVSPLHLESTTT